MKFFKYALLLLLVVLFLGLIYVAMQPSDYNIARSKVIKQPLSKVFNTVNDLKTWEKWGPWHDEDTTIVVTYGDKTVGVDASDHWTSKDGPGAMKTVSVIPNKSICQEITFGDNDPSEILWDFEKVEEGTKVTWVMEDDKAPFFFKIISSFTGGWDKMLGPMLEKGLNNLNEVVKATPDTYTLGFVKVIELEEKFFIGYPYKMKIDFNAMQKVFMESLPRVGAFAEKWGLKKEDYTPGTLYHKWDEKAGETEFHIGLLLHKEIKGGEGMERIEIAGGKYAAITKCGEYGMGDYEAHIKIGAYITENKMKSKFPIFELYPNDPSEVKKEDILTEIYYPIK